MRILITGGAGFIGQQLARRLREADHQVVILDHNPPASGGEYYLADLGTGVIPEGALTNLDGVVHLAGRNIFSRWSPGVKESILRSRVDSTRQLVTALGHANHRPSVFICASAVGFFGNRGEEELDEESPPGSDFLADVCVAWEKEAQSATSWGARVVRVRTAPVLGKGGMLGKLLPVYRLGLGGPLGDGRQWSPWIHMQDIIGIYQFALHSEGLSGPVNACAPELVRNRQFSDALASALHRPAIIPVPRFGLRLLFNDLADAILCSQKVHPRRLEAAGYSFQFPALAEAMKDAIR